MKTKGQDLRERLAESFSEEDVKQAMGIIEGRLDPEGWEEVETWVSSCFHRPWEEELKMAALNVVLAGYGVEGITPEGEDSCRATYVNQGDTYALTVVYDIEEGEFIATDWGTWMENWEREQAKDNDISTHDEED